MNVHAFMRIPALIVTVLVSTLHSQDLLITTTQDLGAGTYNNVTVNGSGIVVTLTGQLNINGTLTMTNGILVTTIGNPVSISDGAAVSGGNVNSYVEGPMLITWPSSGTDIQKMFPLGKSAKYRPMTIKLAAASSQRMRAEVFAGNCGGTPGSGLTRISPLLYFHVLTRAGVAGTTTFELGYYDEDGVLDSKTIKVGRCTAEANGTYENMGSGGMGFPFSGAPGYFSSLPYVFTDAGEYLIHATNDITKNPLPVELVSFDFLPLDNGVVLRWKTATESNNAGFSIERSADLRNERWEKLGFVEGNGTSNVSHEYSYVDRTPPGLFRYRLQQIDRDGMIEYTGSIVASAGKHQDFMLGQNFPNPFNPSTLIQYYLPVSSNVSLKIFNEIGQTVSDLINSEQPPGWHEASWYATASAGTYFYRLEAVDRSDPARRTTILKKMILMK